VAEVKQATGATQVEFLQCDLMDLQSVDLCAREFISRKLPLHILVNNAGIMAVPFELSKQGIESQFATNHFAHFVLTQRLLPLLEQSQPSRIVNVSSMGHRMATSSDGIHFGTVNVPDSYSPWWQYAETKLANILFTKELQRRLMERGVHDVYVNCCHPGAVRTELSRNSQWFNFITRPLVHFFMVSVETGALTQTYLASSQDIETKKIQAEYFEPCCERAEPTANAQNMELAGKLWEWTVNELKAKYEGFEKFK
jgi:NAD(P)-dependent dehydrogenase (short-subunit alcohol dehydrogenase family)